MRAASRPTIASGAIRKLLATLRELEVDERAVCEAARFDPRLCEDLDARVPLASLHELWEVVVARTRRSDLPLVTAKHYEPGDYGLVAFVAMASATVGEALTQVARYMPLWTDEPAMRLHDNGRLEIVHRLALTDRPGLHRATEAMLAEILQGARRATRRQMKPRRVCFRHRAPAERSHHDAFEEFFCAPVRFAGGVTEMILDPTDLVMPMPQLDPHLAQYLRRLANEALRNSDAPASFLDQVRRIIADELQRGLPGVDVVGRRMAVSERTLRRRLEQEGTSFRELLDKTRAEVAESYMRDRRLPLSEVAFLVGFSEPSAFARAFKRWTGSTPTAWRQRLAK